MNNDTSNIKQRITIYGIVLIGIFLFHKVNSQDFQVTDISLPFTTTTLSGMAQDNLDNIWFTTNSQGLYKYNGDDFTLYNHQRDNPNSIISDRLECIYADKSGMIWIGSFASGLSRLDPHDDSFTNFTHDIDDSTSIRSNGIRRITEDDEGRIWIATVNGLDYWDPDTDSFKRDFKESTDADLLSKEHIRTLYLDNSGILWAGSSSPFYGEQSKGGLFRIDPNVKTVKRYISSDDPNSLNNDIVTAVFEDSRGTFWVGTAGDGLHTMDRELGRFQRHQNVPGDPNRLSRPPVRGFSYSMDHIRFIEEDDSGKIWIGTMNNGINVFDPGNGAIKHLSSDESGSNYLPIRDFWSSLKGKDGLMWLAAWSPGDTGSKLIKINLSPIELGHFDVGGPVFSFVDGPSEVSSIFMGSKKAILVVSDDDIITHAHYFTKEGIESFNHLSLDANDNIWGSTEKGLVFYNYFENEHKLYPLYDDELAIGELLNLNMTATIGSDSILVATDNGLYFFDHNDEEFEKIDFSPDYIQARERVVVNLVFVDSKNKIWVGFSNHGLHLLDKDLKTFKDYRFLQYVQDGPYVIKEDEKQNIYVGNWRSGLKVYNEKQDTFLQISDHNGLLKNETRVSDISFITDSTIWLATHVGLLDHNLKRNTSSPIDLKELEEYEITSNAFFTSKNNGFSYVGTSYGFIKYEPDDLKMTKISSAFPKVAKVFSSENNITSQFEGGADMVHLAHNENDLSFTMNYIDFISSTREKRLEYKLEGYEERWRKGNNDEEVFYYKLPAGSYSFVVRKLGQDGLWKEDKVVFKINPPWWKTWWAYSLYTLSFFIGVWLVHKTQKERTIRIEREKAKDRGLAQAKEIEKAYAELKATQAQLVQSEKMASLGELTAGIAHEIQNPLNFVNNFSDVNTELIEELVTEIKDGNYEDAIELAADIKANEEKIQHHGSRADSIVKGMLQHSRTNSGEKQLTDINALCEEYVRLAYHGLRAKDHTFNADFKTDFAKLDKIEVIPQDLGRVLLNIITNAFHAVHEKSKITQNGYLPEVKISTTISPTIDGDHDDVLISIHDNGPGIPEEIRDKIFQPFFTTKPTGEGTGLGLSLSYDIIKAHGGDLRVESEVGESTTFIVSLPTGIA